MVMVPVTATVTAVVTNDGEVKEDPELSVFLEHVFYLVGVPHAVVPAPAA